MKRNDTYFPDCPLTEEDGKVDWNSKAASSFRIYFNKKKNENVTTHSPEHALENALLKEFRKRNSETKVLSHIQPVLLHGQFFQMPTPLSASRNNVTYSKEKGGGIDLMARIRTENGKIHLCICEIKDEPSDSQQKAMSQALAYATFIAKLVTEQPEWWEVFMGHKDKRDDNPSIPEENIIEVVTIMPSGATGICENEQFDIQSLGGMKLRCRTLYYDEEKYKNSIGESTFVFSGTLLNDIKQ